MQITNGVLRHSWASSCLLVAACTGGGSYKAAQSSTVASDGYYQPAPAPSYEPAHAAETPIAQAQPAPERPGLGTTFGEQVYAPISFTPFVRSSPSPWAEVALHYNDA